MLVAMLPWRRRAHVNHIKDKRNLNRCMIRCTERAQFAVRWWVRTLCVSYMTPPHVCPKNGTGSKSKQSSASSTFVGGSQALVSWAGGEVTATGISTALTAAGAIATMTPLLAVILVVGHVIISGTIRLVKKKLTIRADQRAHLEQLNLTGTQAADHFTVIINSSGSEEVPFNAFVSPTDNTSYYPVDSDKLKGLSNLISGSAKYNVRDMIGCTEEVSEPFSVRISMPDILALMRHTWVYDRFCQTKCELMTVVVLRSRKGKTKLRVAWENTGHIDYTKAKVYTVKEWKKTPYAGKTKPMPEGISDVDMALEKTLVFE